MFGLDKFPCSQMEESSKSVFIKNRLALLTRYCSKCPVEFRFCNGADCVTRDLSFKQLIKSSFLLEPKELLTQDTGYSINLPFLIYDSPSGVDVNACSTLDKCE